MSYLMFDLLAVATPAGLLLLRARRRRTIVLPVAVMASVAALWTGPWDGYLVRSRIWSYDPASVMGQLGSVPVEEFGFLALQVLLLAAWALRVGHLGDVPQPTQPLRTRTTALSGAAPWLAVAVLGGLLLLLGGHARYLGLLMVWIAPPFVLQHAVAHDVLAQQRFARGLRAAPVALWLCLCDRLALHLGIWTINPASSTGLTVAGLPVEEALFFWWTCLLTGDGLLLIADPVVLARARALRPRALVPR